MIRFKNVDKFCIWFVALFVLVAVFARSSEAVIIRGGTGTGNTSAPSDDPGWANVGVKRGGLSCVYLGNQWVLTAAHTMYPDGVDYAWFLGTKYDKVDSAYRLHEPGNENNVDLSLFKINGTPDLPSLTISSSAPANGSDVVAIGHGYSREASDTWWNSDWDQEIGTEAYRGFEWDTPLTMRWGENDIDASGSTVNYDWGNTYVLETDFDQSGGQGNDEMQVATGDSGGGMFYKNGTNWELSGILVNGSKFSGQPDETAVYGNKSYAADLSRYRDQIIAIIPEPSAMVMLLGALAAYLCWRKLHRNG